MGISSIHGTRLPFSPLTGIEHGDQDPVIEPLCQWSVHFSSLRTSTILPICGHSPAYLAK